MRQFSQFKSHTQDRFLFLLVCLYWLSQSFLVPLAPIGPSWAVWPTLSDLVVLVMVPVVLYRGFGRTYNRPTQTILRYAWGAFFLCVASFLIATAFYGWQNDLFMVGAYQICRSLEYIVVLLATAQMAMNCDRWTVFRWVALSTFCLVSAGMLLTVSGLVRTSVVSPFLPATPLLAGPWGAFASGGIEDSGFISYNHAYAGMQLILSGGAAYMFFEQFKRIRMLICSLLLLCTFASRSRACFILALLLVFVLEWKRTKSNLFVLVLLCCFGGLWAVRSSLTEDIVERQASSSSSLDEDGLSGRTDIWQEHLNYFAEHPLNVLFGTGYGYAGRVGSNNAHDMYLHVMTETGLAGLLLFLYLQRQTLLLLQSPHMRAMRLTFWALLITGLTQETLYPVAAFSHFLGFYLSALVIALRFGGNLKVAFVPLTRSSVANMICEAEI